MMVDLYIATQDKPQKTKKPETQPVAPGTVTIHRKEMHPFSAFHASPEGITFENQESNEKIYVFLRRHFITNLPWVAGIFVFALLPPLLFLVVSVLNLSLPEIPGNIVLVLTLFYYLILFGFAFVNYVVWFYNVGIITNLRAIDIDVQNLQSKNVAATPLDGIVDVEYTQHGLIQNFFNFGDVHIQTEGLKANFEYLLIPHPARVTDIISDLISGREVTHA